jgi:AcrR family transcriptional regulator
MSMYGCTVDKQPGQIGRPRSEKARTAVLQAVDDLLVEIGYAAMTMKGIAERAQVSRQTVYRWWSTKAEILFEASAADAEEELTVRFLAHSPAGASYRALLGEAQHDSAVAELLATKDVLGDSARVVIERAVLPGRPSIPVDQATALLIGPTFFWIVSGRNPAKLHPRELAQRFLDDLHARVG